MPTLTLRFSRPESTGDVYRLALAHPASDASGAFTRPYDDATWTAVALAQDPAFALDDSTRFSTGERAALDSSRSRPDLCRPAAPSRQQGQLCSNSRAGPIRDRPTWSAESRTRREREGQRRHCRRGGVALEDTTTNLE
jgi:hypothetical protein